MPNVHYKIPKKVDPVRISQNVKKNMLKDHAAAYQKQESTMGDGADINLASKDQELNFSNKNEEDDDMEMKLKIDKDGKGTEIEDGLEEESKTSEKFKMEEEKDMFK